MCLKSLLSPSRFGDPRAQKMSAREQLRIHRDGDIFKPLKIRFESRIGLVKAHIKEELLNLSQAVAFV